MTVKDTPIGQIRPYRRNPRVNEKTVSQLIEAIKQFGFQVPIITDPEGVIITGHARYKAAVQMGLKKVPVIVSTMEPKKAQAFRIADNKVGEASEWNEDLLMQELREIPDIKDMIPFFPDRDLEKELEQNLGQGMKPITQAQIDKQRTGEQGRFSGSNAPALVNVTCPHCAETFQIRKDEVT